MTDKPHDNFTLLKVPDTSGLQFAVDSFILSRRAARYSAKTLEYYNDTVAVFANWLQGHGVASIMQITANHIRLYMLGLQERNLKDTTQHAHARAIKTWLRWLVAEGELAINPMLHVAMPRIEMRIGQPYTPEEIGRLLAACDRHKLWGLRAQAVVLGLLDSGMRLAEFVSLRVGDIDMKTGVATVIGKGRKQRMVVFGARSRAAVAKWIAASKLLDGDVICQGTPHAVQLLLRRLGKKAQVWPCNPHRFRRTFALWMLRDGCDLYTLRLFMGHSDLTVLQRYLAIAGEDLEKAHRDHGPVDRLLHKP